MSHVVKLNTTKGQYKRVNNKRKNKCCNIIRLTNTMTGTTSVQKNESLKKRTLEEGVKKEEEERRRQNKFQRTMAH